MVNKSKLFSVALALGLVLASSSYAQEENDNGISQTTSDKIEKPTNLKFKEEWPSIAQHQTPEWFRDAKFGIYTHLGPAVVATQHKTTEWWGWVMYSKKARYWTNAVRPDSPEVQYDFIRHQEIFGDQNEFGYKELIQEFNPDKFDAKEWADLFEAAGAKFFGPMGVHHDNFFLWDSDITRWDIQDLRGFDLAGELEKEVRSRDLKFVMTFHHAFSWWFFTHSYDYDGSNPEYQDLYNKPHKFSEDNNSFDQYPDQEYEERWNALLQEAAQKYNPDLFWFDMGLELLSEDIRQKAFAGILNNAEKNNQEIGISYKIKYSVCIPPSAGILDFEKGRSQNAREDVWLTDTPLGGWFYNTKPSRSSKAIIEMLVDIVSKNGNLLLDVSPKPDGTIPEDQKETLLGIGEWLDMNGEAIYNTRPWVIAGEGPTELASDGHFNENWESIYTNEDIRFTRSKDNNTLYITVLNKPEGKVNVTKLATIYPYLKRDITSVELIGSPDLKIKWKRNKKGLSLSFPEGANGNHAWSYKVTLAPESK